MENVLENLKVSVKNGKGCEKILAIEVSEETVQQEFSEFYRAVAPKAKIPGFRPGKAPRHILEMNFAEEAKEKVMQNLIQDSFRQAIIDNKVEPLVYPKIQDVKFESNKLSFKAVVEVRPTIKLSKVKGLSAKKEKAEVKETDVEAAIKKVQESLAKFKTVEREAAMGDFVVANYTCFAEGEEIEKRDDEWFELREDEFLKGFSEQLVGVKVDDEKELKVTFPEQFGKKELAGKEASFQIKVKEVKAKEMPEINDEMAKDAGEYNTLEELREKTRKDLLSHVESEKEAAYEKGLLDELVKKNKMDVPAGLVHNRLHYLMDQAKQNFMQQGGTEEAFDQEKDKLHKEFEGEAQRQVHLAFLLEEIASEENITVADDDLEKKFDQVAERVHQPKEQIKKYYEGKENEIQQLKEQVRNEKVIQFIKDNAK